MRKALLVVFLAMLSVSLLATVSLAGVTGTRHDMGTMSKTVGGVTARGVCSYCHVPHGAKGSRLWAGTPATGYGIVANLCSTCHNDGTITPVGSVSRNMFNAASHGFSITTLQSNAKYNQGNNLAASNFPYTTGGSTEIECSSCHDPHDSTGNQRPFLRDTVFALCQRCHASRDEAGTMAANTSGSHVVGATYDGSTTRPVTWVAAYSVLVYTDNESNAPATNPGWVLGGHRTGGTTGGVTCVTCHVVHGFDPTNSNPGGTVGALPANTLLAENLLADTYPTECERCHTANPGAAGTQTHPVEAAPPFAGTVSANALNIPNPLSGVTWTSPSEDYVSGGTGNIICVTCHDTHLGQPNSPALLADNTLSMTTNPGRWCEKCHTGTVITSSEHHPRNIASPVYDTATFGGASSRSALAAPLANQMDCMTCHRAHNTISQGTTGTADFLLTALNWDNNNAGQPTSAMCVACHSVNPSVYTATRATGVYTANTHAGTHLVSIAGTSGTYTQLPGKQAIDNAAKLTVWTGSGQLYSTLTNAYSKYGGQVFAWAANQPSGSRGVLCESCHSVTNPRNARLILGRYDNTNVTESAANDICVACHINVPGTHPVTAVTVSRTGAALNSLTSLFAVNQTALTANTNTRAFYPGGTTTTSQTCMSCHDVHDANTGAGAYILKDGQTAAAMGSPTTAQAMAWPNTMDTMGMNFTDLCAACHPSYR